jgi:ribosomal protein S27AE
VADARHFCPDCGSIDLVHTPIAGNVKCPNCGWGGALSQTIGAVSREQFWDAERLAAVLLRVVTAHAAGPMVQVLEFAGILPRKIGALEVRGREVIDGGKRVVVETPEEMAEYIRAAEIRARSPETKAHNARVQQMRDAVMRRIFEAAITAGFEEAERQHRLYAVDTNTPLHEAFNEEPAAEREFGEEDTKKLRLPK